MGGQRKKFLNPQHPSVMKPISISRPLRRGFTLVEILIVLALIAMLMFFTVPGLKDVFRGSKLTSLADQLTSDLAIARQTAIRENVPVEVRFYKFHDVNNNNEERYLAYQCFTLRQDLNKPSDYTAERIARPVFEKIRYVPQGVILLDSVQWSSILSDAKIRKKTDIVRGVVPGEQETQVEYRSFIITPEGETNLDRSGAKHWYISLVNEIEVRKAANIEAIKPKNFVCLQIDPFTANVRRYQPN
jgi:uncharacterized protein (TIGR02596 family)